MYDKHNDDNQTIMMNCMINCRIQIVIRIIMKFMITTYDDMHDKSDGHNMIMLMLEQRKKNNTIMQQQTYDINTQ